MKRRGFLKSMLAAGVAPAVIGSGILMPVKEIIIPTGCTCGADNGNLILCICSWNPSEGAEWGDMFKDLSNISI